MNGTDLVQADAATEHLITFLPEADLEDEEELVKLGRSLRYHEEMNPPGTNINFVHCSDGNTISLQTYERGVEDLTLACGTGALASAIAAHFHQQRKEKHTLYTINVKGGTLKASFDFDSQTNTYHQLILTGPAHFVFEGIYSL